MFLRLNCHVLQKNRHFPFFLETATNETSNTNLLENLPTSQTSPLRLYLSGISTDVDLSRELGSVVDHGGLEATKAYLYQLHNVSADSGNVRHQRALCWKLLLGYLYLCPQWKKESSLQITACLVPKIWEIWVEQQGIAGRVTWMFRITYSQFSGEIPSLISPTLWGSWFKFNAPPSLLNLWRNVGSTWIMGRSLHQLWNWGK